MQVVLEDALAKITRNQIDLVAAGRTDAGVHAKQMYAHFDFDEIRLVRLGGLEPPASGTTNQRSNQLSYNRKPISPIVANKKEFKRIKWPDLPSSHFSQKSFRLW